MQATRDRLQLCAKLGSGAGDLRIRAAVAQQLLLTMLRLPEFRKLVIPAKMR